LVADAVAVIDVDTTKSGWILAGIINLKKAYFLAGLIEGGRDTTGSSSLLNAVVGHDGDRSQDSNNDDNDQEFDDSEALSAEILQVRTLFMLCLELI
jgi:hypothetical protein